MRQLTLDLPLAESLSNEDFMADASNARAYEFIQCWPNWPANVAALAGPEGSGKTHLSEVWRAMANGVRLAAGVDLQSLTAGFAGVIDNLPGALGETELFHLINHAREQRGHLLIVSRAAPATWPVALADLRSRLKAVPVLAIEPPSDTLLRHVLAKLFGDRQIRVGEPVLSYLVLRMPRSLGAARMLVAEIDRRALEEKAEVTRAFAAKVLARAVEPGLFEPE